MTLKKRMYRMAKSPFFRLGIPTTAAVVLGTLFMKEVVRINQLVPNHVTGIKDEEIVDYFDVKKELEQIEKNPDLDSWVSKRVPRPGENQGS